MFGVRLPWLLLGGRRVSRCCYGVGRLYVRLAERNEQDFVDLVDD